MEEKRYTHTCKNPKCMKTFSSDARNTRYCTPECYEEMQKRHRTLGKRRNNYKKNSPMFRAESMSRKQARYFAINEKVHHNCECCGDSHLVKDLETAHLNQNCFDNELSNLGILCRECHCRFDDLMKKLHPYIDGEHAYNPAVGQSIEELMFQVRIQRKPTES